MSGFQMNPLSSHPPRTPRASIISGTSTGTYGGSIYTPKEEAPRDEPPEDDVELDREDEAVKKRAQRIRKEEIWKEMLKTSQGRDKAFVSDRSLAGMSKTLNQCIIRLLGVEDHAVFSEGVPTVPYHARSGKRHQTAKELDVGPRALEES